MVDIVESHLDKATTFVRNLLIDELTFRGIFLPSVHRLPDISVSVNMDSSGQATLPTPGMLFLDTSSSIRLMLTQVRAVLDFSTVLFYLARTQRLFWPAPPDDSTLIRVNSKQSKE